MSIKLFHPESFKNVRRSVQRRVQGSDRICLAKNMVKSIASLNLLTSTFFV